MALRVGDVFYTFVQTIRTPKEKIIVVVCCEDPVRFVLINTKNAVQVLRTPELGPTQVFMPAADLGALQYDSWIGCEELFAGLTAEALSECEERGEKVGQLPTQYLERVRVAIAASPTIVERQKQRCILAIELELAMRANDEGVSQSGSI